MPELHDIPRWLYELLFVSYALVITGIVLLERRRPASTLAWIFALVFVPILGLLAYLLVGRRRVRKRLRLRERRAIRPIDATRELATTSACPDDLPYPQRGLVQLALRTAAAPLRRAEEVTILGGGGEAFAAMEAAIRGAQRSICLEFYIWRGDATGRRWIELLSERARAGVRVRLLYDDFGSLGTAQEIFAPLRDAGGEVLAFGALRLRLRLRRSRINFRNHRKILTVDGERGFLGGVNVGDEYTGVDHSGRSWHDLLVCVSGDAVFGLEAIFYEDWIAASGAGEHDPNDSAILQRFGLDDLYGRNRGASRGPLVQVIPSGPDLPTSVAIAAQFTAAIGTSQSRCWIATPYFVPDEALLLVLTTAAYRGVDVRILVPSPANVDVRLVSLAARSYYDELLAAGARIYEYQSGMLHAKSLLIDTQVAAIGSANMDIRSFYLNFEVTAMFYDAAVTEQLAEHFLRHLEGAIEIRTASRERLPLAQRLGESFARVLSPLL
ncbi:MAG: cardiolipin synthase [Myxococcales bacterium]|nr:cardiolipin synthase [Myxococcales bacterium]